VQTILPAHSDSAPFDPPNVVPTARGGADFAAGPSTPPPKYFDFTSDVEWCELLLDIVATANSGGGTIRLELDRARASATMAALSVHALVDRLAQYTDAPFDDIAIPMPANATNGTMDIAVGPAEFPISFRRSAPRAAASRLDQSESVFSTGKFYFRRGDHSMPGTSADLQAFFLQKLDCLRRRWLRRIRRVILSPIETATATRRREKTTVPPGPVENLQPVRIVTDPAAPALQPQHVDRLFPWRQKDLVHELNQRLGRRVLTTYDIQAVRRQHNLDARPDFVFHLPGAGRRYSPAVADWMMDEYARNPAFFQKAHAADQAMLRLRRQKPR
jgi:hypothetical protein